MGPLSGWWRLSGNGQQCLVAPIWKYRSGFGDHRFTFFIDLLRNYTFYTNLTTIVHWVVVYRDVAHLITLNLGKIEKRYAKSFDAGLMYYCIGCDNKESQIIESGSFRDVCPLGSTIRLVLIITNSGCGSTVISGISLLIQIQWSHFPSPQQSCTLDFHQCSTIVAKMNISFEALHNDRWEYVHIFCYHWQYHWQYTKMFLVCESILHFRNTISGY